MHKINIVVKETQERSGFLGLLLLLFIGLKLTGVIAWSWLWVLAPIWLPFCTILSIILILGVGAAIFCAVRYRQEEKRRKLRLGLTK